MPKKSMKMSKKWEEAPEYVTQSGVTYEKVYENTVNVDLDLELSLLESIAKKARSGSYVSDQEFIRDILRSMMGTVESIETIKPSKASVKKTATKKVKK
jgi:hypothetical protein